MSEEAVQEVLCPNPSCQKKYRLKGTIPPVFTCTKCGQAMDLSAFAPPPPAPATRSARATGAGTRGSARRGRGAREDEDDDRRPRFEAPKKSNAALIWGSLGGLVLAVVLLIVMMGGKDEPAPVAPEGGGAATPSPTGPETGMGTLPAIPGTPTPVPGVPTPVPGTPGPTAPVAGAPSASPTAPAAAPGTPAPTEPPRRSGGLTPLQVWQPPADVQISAEEKERIERALDTVINDTGRSAQEAEAALVELDRKAIWRVVSEFKTIQDSLTFENRKGLVNAMIVDRILRKIDGYMERKAGVKDRINPESSPDWATGVAKRWNGWLEKGYWKTKLAPWDPRVDEADEGAEKPAPGGR
jgi:hypothetical protein